MSSSEGNNIFNQPGVYTLAYAPQYMDSLDCWPPSASVPGLPSPFHKTAIQTISPWLTHVIILPLCRTLFL